MDGMRKFLLLLGLLGAWGVASGWADDPEPITVDLSSHTFYDAPSFRPSISGDGRYVAFESNARISPDDTGATEDIYIFDRKAKSFRRMTPSEKGGTNVQPNISQSGRYLTYVSYPFVSSTSTAP